MTQPSIKSVNGTPATAWCPNCGDTHLTGRGKCSRCGRAAVAAPTQEQTDIERYRLPGSIPAPASSSATVQLPSTAATRRWLAQTQALISGLKKSQEDALRRAQNAAAEAARLAAAIKHLEAAVGPAALPSASTARWAADYDACIDCGTTSTKHIAHGRCRTCDGRWRASPSRKAAV